MPEIKQKGHDLDVNNIIIHQVTKEAHKDKIVLKTADKILEISKREIFFISDIKRSFANSGKTYGVFEEQSAFTTFQNLLLKYREKNINFLDFTLGLMDFYKSVLPIQATGSFLVFSEYANLANHDDYLLVLAINNKDSYFFTDDLTLRETQSVDLSKIDVASLINLSQWQNFKNGDENINTYLSFKSGLKDLSKYFLKFIGCENKTTKTEGSKRLVKAINDFFDHKEYESDFREEKLEEIKAYCQRCERQGDGASLHNIAMLIDKESPDEFMNFANDEKYSVNPFISIDTQVIKLLTRTLYKSKNKDLILEFDNDLINRKIFLDESNSIIIKDVPDELIKQIQRHI